MAAGWWQRRLEQRLLRSGVLRDPAVRRAFATVPRHRFLPDVPLNEAYRDEVVVTRRDEAGDAVSSSSQPAMMALMLEQLAVRPDDRILEIGTGSGYNAALLQTLTGPEGSVVTVDLDAGLCAEAQAHLLETGFQVRVHVADGWLGWPDGAPYDGIEVTASATDLAPAWWDQLAETGRLVVPVRLAPALELSICWAREGATLRARSLRRCGFIPLRGAAEPPPDPLPQAELTRLHALVRDGMRLTAHRGAPASPLPGAVVIRRPTTTFVAEPAG
jgi:protein-L-isoaspartate(D-aspartate) O-methyltransferase